MMEKEKPRQVIVKIFCQACLVQEGSPQPWSFPIISDKNLAKKMITEHLKEYDHADNIRVEIFPENLE